MLTEQQLFDHRNHQHRDQYRQHDGDYFTVGE
jgi:hypothetical protein